MRQTSRKHEYAIALLLTIVSVWPLDLTAQDRPTQRINNENPPTVGFPSQIIGLILPAPGVIAKPLEDRTQPLVVRILERYPHGSDFRYDIEYYGLEPGLFNLADYLICEDSQASEHLPEVLLKIVSTKKTNDFPVPEELPTKDATFWHAYQPMLIAAGILWVIGLFAILLVGRPRRTRAAEAARPRSVADRLRPLVQRAADGTLDDTGKAELERTLEAFWRQKLNLGSMSANDLRQTLRQHPEAQIMLDQFDAWLYRPGESNQVDLEQLLAPYQSLADADLKP